MSNPKHTPGPWRVDPVVRTLVVGTADPMPIIADTEAASPFGVDVDAANARLIAACPELLEALKTLADEVYRLSGHALSPKTEPIMVQACAAIAKAEGRES